MKKTTVKSGILAIALSLTSLVSVILPFKASAQTYDQLYIFGDSLGDDGNLFKITQGQFPPPPYFQGRFSNGFVWVEDIEPLLKLNPNLTTNFAIAGSTSGAINSASGVIGVTLPSLPFQLNNFTSMPGTVSRDALFVLWVGANDYLIQPPELRVTDSQVVVNNLTNAATTLINKGARNIIIVNLPDLGRTPQEQAFGTSAASSAITNSHNSNLRTALQTLAQQNRNVNIIPLDANALFSEVFAQPSRYGFTNVNAPCFNQAAGTLCSNPDQYLFWDGVHPTAAAHNFIAQYANAVLTAPQAIIPQGDIALNVAKRQVQLIDARLVALRNLPQTPSDKRWGTFLNGDVNFGDKDSSSKEPGYDFTTTGVTAGVDYRVADNLAVGVAVGTVNNNTDLSKNRGNIDVNGYAVSVYSNYAQKDFYANGVISYGGNDFDIKRKIAFDNRTAKADTDGTQFSVNVNSGYLAKSGNVSYGPTIGLRYDRANIDGYTEKGAGSLNMKVKDQEAESLVLSVGVQASVALKTSIGTVIPNIRASYEHQFADDSRTITTELVTQQGVPMRTKTDESDRDYIKLGAGAQMLFSQNLSGAIDYETVIGLEDVSDNVIKGEIRYQF